MCRITIKALTSRGTSRCSRPLFKKPGLCRPSWVSLRLQSLGSGWGHELGQVLARTRLPLSGDRPLVIALVRRGGRPGSLPLRVSARTLIARLPGDDSTFPIMGCVMAAFPLSRYARACSLNALIGSLVILTTRISLPHAADRTVGLGGGFCGA